MSPVIQRAWLLAAAASILHVSAAHAESTYRFNLPSEPLSEAVRSLGRQTGFNILVDSEVGSVIAPPLKGQMTVAQALEHLTAGRGVTIQAIGDHSFFIGQVRPSPANASAPQSTTARQAVGGASQDGAVLMASVQPPGTAQSPEGDAVQPNRSPDQQAPPPAVVTVTGTRIVRNGYFAPTPVTVAPVAELLETTPTNIADALNKLPQFYAQVTTQSYTNAANPAGNYLTLRGLGQGRTLVMMDGVRVPGTSTAGTVDINTLPQMLVQRVDIVTGGASAIYGSDAVGGVVNFILDTHFSGFKGSVQSGVSTYGDAPSNKVSLAFGTKVSDSGHFEVSYEHSQSAAINQADRSYTSNDPGYTGAGTAANPYVLNSNLRMATTTQGGFIVSGPPSVVGQQFVGSATMTPFNAGAPTGSLASATNTGGLQIGGDGGYLTGMQLLKPVDTDNLFARFDYDLGHKITAYAQVAAGLSQTNYVVAPTALTTTVLSSNPYLPASTQAALTGAGALAKPQFASLTMASLPQNLASMQTTHQWDSDLSATFGLKGSVFDDRFSWNASYTHGQGITHVETDNNINTSHFYAALDAVTGPSGSPVCYVSTTASAGLYPGCAPLNFIGQGNESAAALSYIMQNTAYDVINKTDDVSGSISGTAFDDWAGPVSVAANVEVRWASLAEDTDAFPSAPQLTGLRQTWVSSGSGLKGGAAAAPSTNYLNGVVGPQYGADSVWEVSGETVVPLLRDYTLIKNLEFNGALRYTQYSISGPAITWKAGINYQPINDLRFRVTESRDIRAPTLYELFQSSAVTPITIIDPLLNNLTYTVNQYSQGNTNVKPEVASSNTLGLVYSPSWLPRFRMSADYYSIAIHNVIGNSLPLAGGATVAITSCDASGGTSAYCLAIPRPFSLSNTTAANAITAVYSYPINLSEQYVRGVDIEATYGFDMADIQPKLVGHTDLRLLMNYQPYDVTITSPGQAGVNTAGGSQARARLTGTLDYRLGPFKVNWQTSYTGSHHAGNNSSTPTYFAAPVIAPVITHDLSLSYRFQAHGENLQAFVTVNNIFNQAPTIGTPPPLAIPGAQSALAAAAISPLGRYFTLGLRVNY